MNTFRLVFSTYCDARMAKVLLIGMMSGLPWVLFGAIMTLWLKSEGFSRSAIGLFGYVTVVYAFNFLWAPLLDAVRIPYLSKRLGRRKAYIFLMQCIILAATVMMYFFSVSVDLWTIALFALVISSASATQDIAIDAMRIELIGRDEKSKIAAGAALATVGWYAGYNLGGAAALYFADWLRHNGAENPYQLTYLLMAVVIVVMNIFLLKSKESEDVQYPSITTTLRETYSFLGILKDRIKGAVWMPFYEFFQRNGVRIALLLLGFILLFKVGEAFLGRMSLVFYKEVGFSDTDIATYSKLLGWGMIVVFSIIGSLFSIRYGLFKGLIICGIAMAATNLMFAWLAVVGPDTSWFAVTVIVDQFTTAISTVAFVAFISQLCDRVYTATQYALLASVGNFSRTTLSAHSGQLVDALNGDWVVFFILTALAVIPSLLLLVACRKSLQKYF